jgi:pyrimidine oxygenase
MHSIALLTMPPALAHAWPRPSIPSCARSVRVQRIVTGWRPKEYQQMGLWPGDEHFKNRYAYATGT